MRKTKFFFLYLILPPLLSYFSLPIAQADKLATESLAVHNNSSRAVSSLYSGFQNPSIDYRAVPAWWWDGGDPVTEERISWQLEQSKSQGSEHICLIYLAPFKSIPPYMTETWWDRFKFFVERAAALGMKVWLTDGIGWASPLINNTVVEEDPSYRGQILDSVEEDVTGPTKMKLTIPEGIEVAKILGAFAYRKKESSIDVDDRRDLSNSISHRSVTWEAPSGQWKVMIFFARWMGYQDLIGSRWFGRGIGLDYMNPKATRRLIEMTVGQYDKRLKEHMGKTIVGTFQDELVTHHHYGFPPISPLFWDEFRKRKGYDLLPYLGALYHEAGNQTDKVRCDYFDVMIALMEEAFYKPYYQWHQERNMLVSHDQYGRMSLTEQVQAYGDYFRTMRWFSAPGCDDWHEGKVGRNMRDTKLASSIAHLYERPRVWVEALHTAGWGVNLEQQKIVATELAAYGNNIYNEILFNYTTRGSWFEWAPAPTMFHQPYFRHKKPFNDYINRLSFMISQGKHCADVAILYPVLSIQANYSARNGANKIAMLIEGYFYQVAEKVFKSGIDFDFIDEDSLQRSDMSGGRIKVAGESYQVLILPPLTTIRRQTLECIKRFYDQGGMVISMSLLPTASDTQGRNDPRVIEAIQYIFGIKPPSGSAETFPTHAHSNTQGGKAFFIKDGIEVIPRLIKENRKTDFIVEHGEIIVNHRCIQDTNFYLLFNASDKTISSKLSVKARGTPEIWDPETGDRRTAFKYRIAGDYTELELDFDPYQAYFLVFSSPPSAMVTRTSLKAIDTVIDQAPARVIGWTNAKGGQFVEVLIGGQKYSGSTTINDLLPPLTLDGEWRFSIEPTLDNRWGDFRLPPNEKMIGAEVRQFKYKQEAPSEDGLKLGWHRQEFKDDSWETTIYTVGPYWWVLGPIETRGGNAYFETPFIPEPNVDTTATYTYKGKQLKWRPYSFSQQFGIHKDPLYYQGIGVDHYISTYDDYFDLGPIERLAVAYAYTQIYAPREMDAFILTNAPSYMEPFKLWINGQVVSDQYRLGSIGRIIAPLKKGWNQVLLKVMKQGPKRMRFYFYLAEKDKVQQGKASTPALGPGGEPRLRWFVEPSPFTYDLTPQLKKRVGWYRFLLPPGTVEMQVDIYGKARAFVGGEEVPVSPDGTIRLGQRASREGIVCALRIEQETGRYAGAAFKAPIKFKVGEGMITLGDWSQKGLLSYSGIGVYTKQITLPRAYLEDKVKVILDLGQVRTSAEVLVNGRSVGVRCWRPYHFDITKVLREGVNTIQVKVANTLANHGLIGTAWMYIYEETETSGLLGPVYLRPWRKVEIFLKSLS